MYGASARTISNDYAVGGSPLVTTTWDDQGWIVVWSDLLGRTTKYRDVHDDETTSAYDNFGKLTQRVSPLGTESYVYDTYNRLTEQKLDSVTYATVTYDTYGRINYVDYNNAAQMRMTLGRDTLGRTNSMTYRMGDGTTTVSDAVNRTQSGQIVNDIVANGANELWYTYGYDGADRLTSASVGPHSYAYSYGTQNSATCGTGTGTNPYSGKNSNRISQTINGVTTYFCYDYADRLRASSNALYNGGDIPGGVLLTIKPQQAGNNQKQYSLPNIHGDTLLTANAAGTNTPTATAPLAPSPTTPSATYSMAAYCQLIRHLAVTAMSASMRN